MAAKTNKPITAEVLSDLPAPDKNQKPAKMSFELIPALDPHDRVVKTDFKGLAAQFPENFRPTVSERGIVNLKMDKLTTEEDLIKAAFSAYDIADVASAQGCFAMFALGECVRGLTKLDGSSQAAAATKLSDIMGETGRRLKKSTLDNYARACDRIPTSLRNFASPPSAYLQAALALPEKRATTDISIDEAAKFNEKVAEERKEIFKEIHDNPGISGKEVKEKVEAAQVKLKLRKKEGGENGALPKLKDVALRIAWLVWMKEHLFSGCKIDDKVTFIRENEEGKDRKIQKSKAQIATLLLETLDSFQQMMKDLGDNVPAYLKAVKDPKAEGAEFMHWPLAD